MNFYVVTEDTDLQNPDPRSMMISTYSEYELRRFATDNWKVPRTASMKAIAIAARMHQKLIFRFVQDGEER
ncbi:MAG: hypothetical protein V1928_01445 [Parcubacteria group bacterium]